MAARKKEEMVDVVIEVDEECITQGLKAKGHANKYKHESWCASCPVAIAIEKHFRRPYFPSVAIETFVVYRGSLEADVYRTSNLPIEASNFIRKFDSSGEAVPFSFTLAVPSRFLKRSEA